MTSDKRLKQLQKLSSDKHTPETEITLTILQTSVTNRYALLWYPNELIIETYMLEYHDNIFIHVTNHFNVIGHHIIKGVLVSQRVRNRTDLPFDDRKINRIHNFQPTKKVETKNAHDAVTEYVSYVIEELTKIIDDITIPEK